MAGIKNLLARVAPIGLLATAGIVAGAGLACDAGSAEMSPEAGQSALSAPADEATSVPGSLGDLRDIEELRALFNQDTGVTRLVLLLSPT